MRAVIIATGATSPPGAPGALPAPLRPLLDRPFIQHVVERLVQGGIADLDFVLCERPQDFEALLGDGTRWGGSFRHHLVRHPDRPYGALRKALVEAAEECILLGHAERMPDAAAARLCPPRGQDDPVLFYWREFHALTMERRPRWCGWAWVPRTLLAALPEDLSEPDILDVLLDHVKRRQSIVEVRRPASVRSHADLLAAHCEALEGRLHGLLVSGRERRHGVRLGRNVHISPSARLVAPVFVGENTRIGPGVRLGPRATVGGHCVLEEGCSVADSVILPGTYVGGRLEVRHSVVEQRQFFNVRMGTSVAVTDNFVLGSVTDAPVRRWLSHVPARLTAAALLVASLPLLVVAAGWLKVRRGWALARREAVRLPAFEHSERWPTYTLWTLQDSPAAQVHHGWRDLLLRVVPGLASVVRGHLGLVGVRPRTRAEVAALPSVWRELYLGSRAGLICEADVACTAGSPDEEQQLAEAVQAALPGLRRSLRVMRAYLASMRHSA